MRLHNAESYGRQVHRRSRVGRREGVALLLVLLFVVLLSALVIEFAYESQVEASLTMGVQSDLDAYVAAKSAVAAGMGLLMQDLAEGAGVNTQASKQSQQLEIEESDSFMDAWAQGVPYQQINQAVMQTTIADEYGKLNLNALFPPESLDGSNAQQQEPDPELDEILRVLFESMQVENPDEIVDSILDWIDMDEDTRPNGAESDFYSSIEPPYACRNGFMTSIEELLLIKGITPEIFFDCNMDQGQRESERERLYDLGAMLPSLAELLTVYGHPEGKANVNTAHPMLLEIMAQVAGMDASMVDGFVQSRLETPIRNEQELAQLFPQGQEGMKKATFRSDVFRIYGDGRAGETLVRVQAFVARASAQALAQTNGMGTDGQPLEPIRVIDWRVIR